MKSVIALTSVVGAVADFESWKAEFGKVYNGAEEEHARANWLANDALIQKHNAEGDFELGHNQFSDMSIEEFSSVMLGFKMPETTDSVSLGVHEWDGSPLADSVDWTTQGAVTPVKDQGQCGSCWSFSTTGGLEGAWQVASGQLTAMSEQQFVDCDHNGDKGCNGGLMDNAFKWAQNQAICSEASYPYKARGGSCQQASCTTVIPKGGVTGHQDVAKSESALMSALNSQPVSIAVEANLPTFQLYRSGVMSGICGAMLDHGILAVGYGETNGKKYWKVKNSWGTSWGQAGYGLLLRGKGGAGECGILNQASFPKVSASIDV